MKVARGHGTTVVAPLDPEPGSVPSFLMPLSVGMLNQISRLRGGTSRVILSIDRIQRMPALLDSGIPFDVLNRLQSGEPEIAIEPWQRS